MRPLPLNLTPFELTTVACSLILSSSLFLAFSIRSFSSLSSRASYCSSVSSSGSFSVSAFLPLSFSTSARSLSFRCLRLLFFLRLRSPSSSSSSSSAESSRCLLCLCRRFFCLRSSSSESGASLPEAEARSSSFGDSARDELPLSTSTC